MKGLKQEQTELLLSFLVSSEFNTESSFSERFLHGQTLFSSQDVCVCMCGLVLMLWLITSFHCSVSTSFHADVSALSSTALVFCARSPSCAKTSFPQVAPHIILSLLNHTPGSISRWKAVESSRLRLCLVERWKFWRRLHNSLDACDHFFSPTAVILLQIPWQLFSG